MFVEKLKLKKHKLLIILIFTAITMLTFLSCSKTPQAPKDKPSENFNDIIVPIVETKEDKKNKIIASFKELDMQKAAVNFNFEGKPLNLTLPIYINMNRYYLPLTEIAYSLDGEQSLMNDSAYLNVNGKTYIINIRNKTYMIGNIEYKFSHKLLQSGDVLYVFLFDITKMMNLKTDWSYNNNTISLFNNMDKIVADTPMQSGRPALVRLEDIAVSDYRSEEKLEKLRIMADYLYSKNVPFHIAWIPRAVIPYAKYDEDLTVNSNIVNANFLFTLDYMIDKNGVLGLHGYTHQHGNEISGEGTEFSASINPGESETRERLEKAIEVAKKLDLQYYFFESPHYSASPKQISIMEQYFDIIYQPRDPNFVTNVKAGGRIVKFIPTPLDYVYGKTYADAMLRKIDSLRKDALGSFFYHANLEMDSIKLSKGENGYPTFTYSDDGILKRLISHMQSKGFKFVKVTALD